jgi:adenylate kinase family enzyme
MQRIVIVGTSGSGKTTLGKNLSQKLGIPHIELDSLYWEPNWQETDRETFRQRVQAAISQQSSWVLDGNYSKTRDLTWSRAQVLVWLDYSRCVVLRRILWRTFSRAYKKESLWQGNQESWSKVLSLDSAIVDSMKSFNKRKNQISGLIQQPEYTHLGVLRFKTPKETDEWLASL